jgi:hypothetical protein
MNVYGSRMNYVSRQQIIHPYDIRILQYYKRNHLRDTLDHVFHERCVIRDEILNIKARGIWEIEQYLNTLSNLYDDVYVSSHYYFPNNEIHTRWARVKTDGEQIYGFDHLILKDDKFIDIYSRLDKEKTKLWKRNNNYEDNHTIH